MKRILCTLMVCFLIVSTIAAYPMGLITIRAEDEAGVVVSNAAVIVSWKTNLTNNPWDGAQLDGVEAKTNEIGEVVIEKNMSDTITVQVSHESFYESVKKYSFDSVSKGKWQPWNSLVVMKLKKCGNKNKVYSRQIHELKCPQWSVGYDFFEGDFVTPHGKGKSVDCFISIVIENQGSVSRRETGSRAFGKLQFTFPGKFNGFEPIEEKDILEESDFKEPRYAFEDGYDGNEIIRQTEITIIPASKETNWIPLSKGEYKREPESNVVFFRIRSEINPDGSFKSAFYGKFIIPNLELYELNKKTIRNFQYWLNPTRNDRNMEFDEAKNLFDPKWQKTEGSK